jgi:hypothetical protein
VVSIIDWLTQPGSGKAAHERLRSPFFASMALDNRAIGFK